jgi:hypothetical protein
VWGGSDPEPRPVVISPSVIDEPDTPVTCNNEQYAIVSASDDGSFDPPYGPLYAIDGVTASDSR